MQGSPAEEDLGHFLEKFRALELSPLLAGSPASSQRSSPRSLSAPPRQPRAHAPHRRPHPAIRLPPTTDATAAALNDLLAAVFANQPPGPDQLDGLPGPVRQRLLAALATRFVLSDGGQRLRLRRPRKAEEERKLVLKRGLRALFREFKAHRQHFICGLKALDELEFYRQLFGPAARARGESVDCFLLPGSKLQRLRQSNSRGRKTVTQGYLLQLLESRAFRAAFEAYLNARFLEEYQLARRAKLLRVAQLLANGAAAGFQLPWSDEELTAARDSVRRVVLSTRPALP